MAVGKVYLVGAGPGDPGLLTLKGQRCLEIADLVLYDGLVNPSILRHSPAIAERTSRVSGPDGKKLNQTDINARLVAAAKEGKTVVRLKGGDPYIFGRGTEEAEALKAAGVPFEVVPGVTAATAAGEYAGISVTHRRLSSAVAFVTGHEDPTKPQMLDYASLAAFPGTLVFYMGLGRIAAITASLIKHGKSSATPVCVVSRASRARQRSVSGSLADIAESVASAGLAAPSLIIVGECAKQRDALQWFEQLPLFGKRIAVTRDVKQAEPVIRLIHELGGEATVMPLIEVTPPSDWGKVDEAIDCIQNRDWIAFTSANGVRHFLNRLLERGLDMRRLSNVKLGVVGSATADVLAEFSLRADLIAPQANAESLADALKSHGADSVLWPCGNRARKVLVERLTTEFITVWPIVVYESSNATVDDRQLDGLKTDVDWVPLASPAMARAFAELDIEAARQPKIVTISPLTSATARECGLTVHAEAWNANWPAMLQAIREHEAANG